MATKQMKRPAAHLPIPTLRINITSTATFGFGLWAGEKHSLIVFGSMSRGDEHSVLFVCFANRRFVGFSQLLLVVHRNCRISFTGKKFVGFKDVI